MPSEERLKVLKMVEEGKISAEDAIELLTILDETAGRRGPSPVPPIEPIPMVGQPARREGRWLRVRVTDTDSGKTRVNVRLPIGMVTAGIKMGMKFSPEVQGMDINELTEFVKSGEVGQIVDVFDEDDGEHVEVFIE